MVDTDERWRAAVIGGGGDAATATEPSLPAAITRRLRELAWEDKDKEKARTVVDLVDSETPIECDHEEGHLCPSPCSDIPSSKYLPHYQLSNYCQFYYYLHCTNYMVVSMEYYAYEEPSSVSL